MIDVVVDEDALGRRHRTFDGGKLAGDVKARFCVFNHADDMAKVPFGALQTLDQIAMSCVLVRAWHGEAFIPHGGYSNCDGV